MPLQMMIDFIIEIFKIYFGLKTLIPVWIN